MLLVAFFPLVFVGMGVVVLREASKAKKWANIWIPLWGAGAVLGGGAAFVMIIVGTLVPDLAMRLAVARHHYQVVEGVVTGFMPGDVGDHIPEGWTLVSADGPHRYTYSPSVLGGAGYDRTAAHGGQVRRGIHARVWDVRGCIVRLELAP